MLDINCEFPTVNVGTQLPTFLLGNMDAMDLMCPNQVSLGSYRNSITIKGSAFFKSLDCSLGIQERDAKALFCRAELDGCPEELGRWDWMGT